MPTGIAPGDIVARVYFRVPNALGYGQEFDTHQQAFDHCARLVTDRAHAGLLVPSPVIDERWLIEHTDGTTTDVTVQRLPYNARPAGDPQPFCVVVVDDGHHHRDVAGPFAEPHEASAAQHELAEVVAAEAVVSVVALSSVEDIIGRYTAPRRA